MRARRRRRHRHGLGRAVAALVLATIGPILAAGPAQASYVLSSGDTLYVNPLDDLDHRRDITVTEADGRLLIRSEGDALVAFPGFAAPCEYVSPPAVDEITCDPTGVSYLAVVTGRADDHITVEATLPATICGGPGNDVLSGGPGRDIINGAAGGDAIRGGGGDDIVHVDHVAGQEGSTAFLCTADPGSPLSRNTADGGAGDDVLAGDEGPDELLGGPGGDFLFGRPGDDELDGQDGEDLVVGLDGDDVVRGGAGTDVLSGGSGADRLLGGEGKDELGLPVLLTVERGGPVETSVEDGADLMNGGADDDTLFAGPGERAVAYGVERGQRPGGRAQPNGADVLVGGAGRDHVSYIDREAPVSASLNGRADDGAAGEGDDIASDVELVTGGARADILTGGPDDDTMDGGPGADTLSGLAGNDDLAGGSADQGADSLSGGAGADAMAGGPGDDQLAGGDGKDAERGGGGNDALDGGPGDDMLYGEADADALVGGAGADLLDGGAGKDVADYARTARAVTVSLDGRRNDGEAGDDAIVHAENVRGGAGADTLAGDASANVIDGGPGHDVIDPGGGVDAVAAGAGRDAVRARDGARDAIACGAGTDLAIVDEEDSLGSSAELCERADDGARRDGEALLRPAGCSLDVRLPGMPRPLAVREALSIPRRTTVDATRCAAGLSTVPGGARVRASRGAFTLQRPGATSIPLAIRLAGLGAPACRNAPAARRLRRLTIRARGTARVIARYAAAVGRNATWTMQDRCGSTVTRVLAGSVRVKDRGRRRAVVVRARGRPHRSRPPGGDGP